MAENDSRYGKNRNQWKRSYPYTNRKPVVAVIEDAATNRFLTFDLNRLVRHRNYFELRGSTVLQVGAVAEYEEGTVSLVSSSEGTFAFDRTFDGFPFVCYSLETQDGSVNVFGTNTPGKKNFSIGTSAPFTGNINYFAVTQIGPSASFVDSGGPSGSFWVYGGLAAVDATKTEFTASFNVPSGALNFRIEAHDAFGNMGSNVTYVLDKLGAGQATGRISAPLTDNIHFHATSIPCLLYWASASFNNVSERLIWLPQEHEVYGTFGAGTPATIVSGGLNYVQLEGARGNFIRSSNAIEDGTYTSFNGTEVTASTDNGPWVDRFLEIDKADTVTWPDTSGPRRQSTLGGSWNVLKDDEFYVFSNFHKSAEPGGADVRFNTQISAKQTFTVYSRFPNPIATSVWQRTAASGNISNGPLAARVQIRDPESGTNAIYSWCWQMESGSFPSSPIITPSAMSASREADNMTYPSASIPSTFRNGKWTFNVVPYFENHDLESGTQNAIFQFDADNFLRIRKTSGGEARMQWQVSGSSTELTSYTYNRHDDIRVEIDFPKGIMSTTLNGDQGTLVAVTASSNFNSDPTFTWPTGSNLYVGQSHANDRWLFGLISEPVAI